MHEVHKNFLNCYRASAHIFHYDTIYYFAISEVKKSNWRIQIINNSLPNYKSKAKSY